MDTQTKIKLSEIAKDWPWRAKRAKKTVRQLCEAANITAPTLYGAINGTSDTRISIIQRVEDALQGWGV